MTGNRFLRRPGLLSPEPKFGRMLGTSLALHLVVVLLFTGVLMPRMKSDPRPVYVVDLVNLPVANPQAGRPDAPPKPSQEKPKPKPEPQAAPKPAPPPPKPQAKPAPKATPKPQPPVKPVVKEAPKTDYRDTVSVMEKMRRQQEIERLKQSLAGLQNQDTRKNDVKAPLGEVTGTGNEAGVGQQTWLQEYYTRAWRLSRYQVSRLDLETTVLVVFDARGYLKDYRLVKASGDQRFDDTVTQAIRSLDKLQLEPGQRVEYTIHFNLKDLIDR